MSHTASTNSIFIFLTIPFYFLVKNLTKKSTNHAMSHIVSNTPQPDSHEYIKVFDNFHILNKYINTDNLRNILVVFSNISVNLRTIVVDFPHIDIKNNMNKRNKNIKRKDSTFIDRRLIKVDKEFYTVKYIDNDGIEYYCTICEFVCINDINTGNYYSIFKCIFTNNLFEIGIHKLYTDYCKHIGHSTNDGKNLIFEITSIYETSSIRETYHLIDNKVYIPGQQKEYGILTKVNEGNHSIIYNNLFFNIYEKVYDMNTRNDNVFLCKITKRLFDNKSNIIGSVIIDNIKNKSICSYISPFPTYYVEIEIIKKNYKRNDFHTKFHIIGDKVFLPDSFYIFGTLIEVDSIYSAIEYNGKSYTIGIREIHDVINMYYCYFHDLIYEKDDLNPIGCFWYDSDGIRSNYHIYLNHIKLVSEK